MELSEEQKLLVRVMEENNGSSPVELAITAYLRDRNIPWKALHGGFCYCKECESKRKYRNR